MEEQEVNDDLWRKYLHGKCTIEEKEKLTNLLDQPIHRATLQRIMETETTALWSQSTETTALDVVQIATFQDKLQQRIQNTQHSDQTISHRSSFRKKLWLRYAAIFIGFTFLATGVWYLQQQQKEQIAQQMVVIAPGGDQAVLTLSNGKTISLSDASTGQIANQEGVKIKKTKDGEIVYANQATEDLTNTFNSVSTPHGGQYSVVLPDGSKAWLNAGSTLTYPVQFKANLRQVKMTGEVYFEVAKLPLPQGKGNVPFIVDTEKQRIQVLGTQFNVNAYTDEDYTRTTLVEGSVKVTALNNGQTILLKPGQQATLSSQLRVEGADIEQQLAWKNGDFIFRGDDLNSALRQVARWYNIEVDCPPHLGQLRFNAMLSRSKPISTLIDIIETTHKNKIKIVLNGRRLTVKD